MTLSSWVPALYSGLEQRTRQALGLDDRVQVVLHSRETRAERRLIFTVVLPSGLELEMDLADSALGRRGWRSAGGLELFLRTDGTAALTDPATAPSLQAIGQLFQRRQSRAQGKDAEELWAEHARVQPVLGLDDSVYRRIFDGVQGRTANLRLGFRCNQDCGLCWQSRQWPDPPPELYVRWLDELAAEGVRQLTISGGEPTLHRRLPELLHRAKAVHGMRTMLQTNAVQLAKPAILERVVAAAPDRIFVSLHAADAELSDRITRAPGTWQRTVKGVENALLAGLRVGLNTVVDQLNVDHLPALSNYIAARFVRGVPDNPVESWTLSRPQTYFDRALWRRRLVSMERVGPAVQAAVATLQPLGVVLDVTSGSCGLPPCILGDHPELIWLPAENEVGMADPGYKGHPEGSACHGCALGPRCQGPGHGYRAAFGEAGLRPFASIPPGMPTGRPLEL